MHTYKTVDSNLIDSVMAKIFDAISDLDGADFAVILGVLEMAKFITIENHTEHARQEAAKEALIMALAPDRADMQ